MPPEHRTTDRPCYYTMKTPAPLSTTNPQGLPHSRSNSPSYFSIKPTTSPLPSRPPSVGQPHPPKPSPGASRGSIAHDGRTPSPNYFGIAVEAPADARDSITTPRENWGSPSSVKSFVAGLPKQLPLDANPEFEAFRRQVDANRARVPFNLSASNFSVTAGGAHTPPASTPSALQRPRPPKRHTQAVDGSEFPSLRAPRRPAALSSLGDAPATAAAWREAEPLQGESAYTAAAADSQRNSGVSIHNSPLFLSIHMTRHNDTIPSSSSAQSPLLLHPVGEVPASKSSPQLVALGRTAALSPRLPGHPGGGVAAHVPPAAGAVPMISPADLKDLLESDQNADTLLLLDLRVSPQFAQSRVRGALNLCIPTTLLKRATFNLQKLQQTFQADGDQEKFSSWRDARHLVVYDASSSDSRDATSATNMIKKFVNEGYAGRAAILRGGFAAFSAAYPDLVDRSSNHPATGLSLGPGSLSGGGGRASLPPIIGGVVLPSTTCNPSPFFDNIRQNQDLVDGVGQLDIEVPTGLAPASLPRWLRDAAAAGDRGKRVSDEFLSIERAEQSRMREAYATFRPLDGRNAAAYGEAAKVRLSGIEKGGKNRYKDILPFDHTRVRLQGRPKGSCDYVNASHLRASRSHKRYIASQGPLPATFEDFWSVIWDNDVRVIVMLTAESEGGQLKCHAYWKDTDFGPLKLRVLSETKVSLDVGKRRTPASASTTTTTTPAAAAATEAPDPFLPEGARRRANTTTTTLNPGSSLSNPFSFTPQATGPAESQHVIIRKFALTHTAHPSLPPREVTQLHYPSWPDFGAPAQPGHLLALVELANALQRGGGDGRPPLRDLGPGPGPPLLSASSSVLWGGGSMAGGGGGGGPEPQEQPARPMLVHCSAGCGRTGAFCTVDSVIDMLKRQRQHMLGGTTAAGRRRRRCRAPRGSVERDLDGDTTMGDDEEDAEEDAGDAPGGGGGGGGGLLTRPDGDAQPGHADDADDDNIDTSWLEDDGVDLIAQTVEDFRGQRLSMVQSLRQFVLCYETILEWIRRLQQSAAGGRGAAAEAPGGAGRMRSGSLAF